MTPGNARRHLGLANLRHRIWEPSGAKASDRPYGERMRGGQTGEMGEETDALRTNAHPHPLSSFSVISGCLRRHDIEATVVAPRK
ncbi:hypothetical protein CMUS01_08940 [Colletotrichum musicola]|uniref:Uncharacterized protein n=1 Tax=Colletotrichum musicola TaxID=2175873 RepID=A0A8H6KA86_9PEZI|nr:hypothetical protein CMUS01_08940 [Colletotrichum musicola]